jgi:hypothetical protein
VILRNSTRPGLPAALLCVLALPLIAGKCGKQDDTVETGDTGLSPADFWEIESLYGVANLDDDDQDGTVDWDQAASGSDDDLAALTIPAGIGSLDLVLDGAGVRVWLDGVLLLDEATTTASVDATEERILGVEFHEPMEQGSLSFTGADNANTVALMAAPLTLNNHFQVGTHLWMLSVSQGGYSNATMVSQIQAALGSDRVTAVAGNSYGNDVWVQDEFEFGYRRSDANAGELVLDSIRSQGGRYLDSFPENELQEPGVAIASWGNGTPNSLDSFGNLETSPPVSVGGVDYPLGRIYYGGDDTLHPSAGLTSFLKAQEVQSPVRPDSSWLCVGHVDEFFTFVPDSSAEKGFKLLVTDVDLAWQVLEGMDPDTRIDRYRSAHGVSTVGDLVNDQALRDMNEDIQLDEIERVIEDLKADFGLDDSDITRVPGIWEENQWCGNYVLALIPGLVNLAVFTEAEGDNKLLIADPFLREDESDQSSDPYIALWDSLMPPGNETFYVDNWDVYHEGWGEVHCGTNIHREPGPDWFTEATHLLGGEE